jgi:PIN domain nuclease of toxin-antitoxin system
LSPYDDFIRNGIVGNDFIVLPIEAKHTSLLTDMPVHHKDPFDRILIAQALVEGISLISIDSIFDQYGVTRIW